MAGYPGSDFPTSLDTLNQIGPGGPSEQTPNAAGQTHPGIHAQLAAAILAIQTLIGVTSSSNLSSLQAKIRNSIVGVVALVDGAHIATNAALGSVFDVTIDNDRILDDPTNPTDGQLCTWRVKQGVGGSRLLTYGASFDFGVTGAPTLSTAVGKIDHIIARYNGATSSWEVIQVALGF